ncbi:flagellar biosynthesis anti-sigma factor FlgM [Pollutimonas harenae]|uniref:Negative regulator of flagellin synthesis n=1 Tax=Pollutimonas harenae TaxID=657015 RepID=A0A853H9H4_9BURK|nr:flagellar biosynthesis anti-sigma factor FlgM [Pollutimonas harenae]NYT87073.1 flagellar biosynthesis anti-sigma factor FlgM [Pollutimonas harenae]TEA71292.1 flagellar biosynthesis anti-sigma factor FlgM [Pollutimonas harenae]
MKITSSPLNTPTGPVAGTRSDGVNNTNVPASGSAASGKPSVDLSSAARHLSSLENADNDVDVARVQELRDAIASGQLKIDPSRIADGLLASVRDLLK